jgi:hypothetical protein
MAWPEERFAASAQPRCQTDPAHQCRRRVGPPPVWRARLPDGQGPRQDDWVLLLGLPCSQAGEVVRGRELCSPAVPARSRDAVEVEAKVSAVFLPARHLRTVSAS